VSELNLINIKCKNVSTCHNRLVSEGYVGGIIPSSLSVFLEKPKAVLLTKRL